MGFVGVPSRVAFVTRRGFQRAECAILSAIGLLCLAAFMIISPAQAAAPHCPPGACVDLEEATKLKQDLKREMARAGAPPRLQALVDRLPNCADCIRASRLSVVTVHERAVGDAILDRIGEMGTGYDFSKSGSSVYLQTPWSPNRERRARAQLANGRAKAIHFTLLQGPCICCPENEDEAKVWRANGGAARVSATLFNNQVVKSILSADQLGPTPRDLYELDPSLTREAIDGPIVVSDQLPITFPSLERYVSVICPQCRALAAQRNALVEKYNTQREQAASEYFEGSRLLRLHVDRESESLRIRALIAPPTAANPEAFTDQRNFERLQKDSRLLTQANALFASSRVLLKQMEVLKQEIEPLDIALLECDQQPCKEAETALDAATEPSNGALANDRVSQTFAAFAGLAFKNSLMSSNLNYISGTQEASGDATVSSAALSFGLMAYPFAGLPIYVSAEGMVFAGSDGNFYTATLHPGLGDDTTAEGRAVWAGRVSLGVTFPVEGGCISRSSCFLVDVDGGVVLERLQTTFVTDESGGGGQRNTYTFDHTHLGFSVGAALSVPLCAFMDVSCGLAIAPFGRLTWFPDAEETFSRTTTAGQYAGGFDIDTQVEVGIKLVLPFGPTR